MFDSLSSRLEGVIKKIRGKGRLTESDVDEVLKEIRTALLEADVNVGVVRNVVSRIREQAIGVTRSQAIDPGQPRRRDSQDHVCKSATHSGVDGWSSRFRQDH
ncbi:MAG: ffh [Acidimicrobiaceae bacterium]|nr:MAG: ffh [Acidimicrobiaceae bacterium]